MSDKTGDDSRSSTKRSSSQNSNDVEPQDPPPLAFSLAALGLQPVGTKPPPKPQPAQPKQMLNARGMPARIRKRNRFFFDDNIINDDKPLRMSLSPRKTPLKVLAAAAAAAAGAASSTSNKGASPKASPISSKGRLLKKRKPISIRFNRPTDAKRSAAAKSSLSSPSRHSVSSGPSTPKSSKKAQARTEKTSAGASPSSSKAAMEEAAEANALLADKNLGHQIGMRLRNLLKLPKAHKWVIYEWFYSFIDKPLFEGENDFQICLNESFPHLKTRQLTRAEWRKIRSLMGKPRRCSTSFFMEERRDLERKRQKLRYLQTQRSGDVKDINFMRDLPDRIPLPLPVGTKVTARLRVPQDGAFSGSVDAFDSLSSTYRVTFDRPGLGTHSVPDIEIVSENFNEMLTLQSFTRDFRPNLLSMFGNERSVMNTSGGFSMGGGLGIGGSLHGVRSALKMNLNKSDPLLGQEVIDSPYRNPVLQRDNLNGYPVKLLETMVRLRRALAIKKVKLQRLSEMNDEAELRISEQNGELYGKVTADDAAKKSAVERGGPQLSEEFQRRYASIVISLEKMNEDMQGYLNELQSFSPELTRDPQMQAMIAPTYLREKCRESAQQAVLRNNHTDVQQKNLINLIKNLATVLVVASHLKNDSHTAHVSKVLDGCIEEVKSTLHSDNVETFQKHVLIHLHHIHSIFGQNSIGGGDK